ncbi:hypothetical protein NM688_g5706 [Phlebia brevispora]|uniref:Uncharacterized protein n=1 Tax=Phlebia brevispora TaxID=194682 RepID=A0ACC1SR36_9APHY|nr:hypothetical protein NM688_g5706 [Phlebia brevispora]
MPAGELNTATLVHEILRAGKNLFVPKVDPAAEGRMDFVKVYSEEDLNSFPEGLWGIKEPNSHWNGQVRPSVLGDPGESLDLIIVPGVAFDRSLSRLGHGKGYYDRFITAYVASRGSKKPFLGRYLWMVLRRELTVIPSGLALREQIIGHDEVPVVPHDWKMDAIVSPDGVLGKDLTELP